MRKLGVYAMSNLENEANVTDQLSMIKDAGFDCFFTSCYEDEPIGKWANTAVRLGLEYETLHTPFFHMNDLWTDSSAGDYYLAFLITRVDICSQNAIKTCIIHTTIHSVAPPVCKAGLIRFRKLSDYARQHGVRIAYENLEIPEHLAAVMADNPEYHGLCWDCGHNYCYTPMVDMMDLYGDRLLCTHIHDNFGIRTPGLITYKDDLHMLPMDGGLNWQGFADRIKRSGYAGPLTLELSVENWPEYQQMPLASFYREACLRALKLREMCD